MQSGEQLYIAGTEPPRNPEIEQALRSWLNARDEAKSTSERVRLRLATLLNRMTEAGIERYPFVDDRGGKRQVLAARDTRARVVKAPGERTQRGRRARIRDDAPPLSPPVAPSDVSDPFASTRRKMNDAQATRDAERSPHLDAPIDHVRDDAAQPAAWKLNGPTTASSKATRARRAAPAKASSWSFAVGGVVAWSSQAGGVEKRKRGTIVAVVPAGRTPSSIDAAYKFASSRTHESYVVDVDGELYWPLVPKLRIRAAKEGR